VRRFALAAFVFALAGCASGGQDAAPSEVTLPPPTLPPPPIVLFPAPISVPPPPDRDQCGAWELQDLVGKPRTEIPVPVDPSRRRVVCSTCPMTMDFNAGRLTIVYDAATNLVTRVSCN
jgi:hypothetical protein